MSDRGLGVGVAGPGAGPAVLGLRPEAMRLDGTGAPLGPAEVRLVELTGSEIVVTLDLGGHPVVAALPRRRDLARGDRVALGFDPAAVHLFDRATGARLAA